MRRQHKTKRAGTIGILFLVAGWLLIQGATSVEGRVSKQIDADKRTESLVLMEVRVEEVPVMRAESEHFILEWMEREVAGKAQEEVVTGLESQSGLPKVYSLSQNYPNPFNPSTTIAFDIPAISGEKQFVNLTVYDIRGRRVRTLINSNLEPGSHKIHWNGRNDRGQSVASGIYLYTLKAGEEIFTRKMIVLK
jgi:hypothetical protein